MVNSHCPLFHSTEYINLLFLCHITGWALNSLFINVKGCDHTFLIPVEYTVTQFRVFSKISNSVEEYDYNLF